MSTMDVLPDLLLVVRKVEVITALALASALYNKAGKLLPEISFVMLWMGAFKSRYLKRTVDSKP
jgi:hypothetical protein